MWERRLLKLLKAKQILNCTLPITLLTKLGYLNRDNISTKRSPTVQQCDLNILFSTIYEHLNSTNSNTQSDAELTGISYWLNRLQMSGENPCRLPCDHWEYNYAVERDLEYPNRDFAGLTITIVDSQYPHCREVPALEWLDYLALIGGTWGLWSGASAITVVQMIVYSGRCLLHLSSRKWWNLGFSYGWHDDDIHDGFYVCLWRHKNVKTDSGIVDRL